MLIQMLSAFLLAFLLCAVWGKKYVSLLKKRNVRQPLKAEVAQIYAEKDEGTNTES